MAASTVNNGGPIDPKARRRRRWRRALLGAALLLVLVPTTGILFLQSDAGGEFLRKQIVGRLAERTTGTPSLGKVSFSLASGISLADLVLRQADGQEAVRVAHVLVHPGLLETVRGRPTLAALEVSGGHIVAAKKLEGGTSLDDLLKRSPPPATPTKPAEPRAYVRLASLAVKDVDFDLTAPDGARLGVSHIVVNGELTARPRTRGVELSMQEIGATLLVVRPDGTRLALDDLKTSVTATLVEGAGPVRVGGLAGTIALTPPGGKEVRTPLSLGPIDVTLSPGQLSVAAETLSALFLSVGSISVKGGTKDDALAGPQAAKVTALRVDADTLARLMGRKVLAQPLTLELSADGTPEAIKLAGSLASAGQSLSFDGHLDTRAPDFLAYDVAVTTRDFAVAPLLATEAPPDVKVGALRLSARGHGVRAETVAVDVGLSVQNLLVRGNPVDSIELQAHFEKGRVTIGSLEVKTLGQAVHAEGSYVLADRALELDVRTSGSVQQSLAAARALGLAVPSSPALATLDLPEGGHVKVRGNVGGALWVTVPGVPVRVLGATARVDAEVQLNPTPPGSEKKIEATSIEATALVAGLSPRSLASARGKTLEIRGGLGGTVHISGPPRALVIDASLGGRLGAESGDDMDVALKAHVAGGIAKATGLVKTIAGKRPSEPLLTFDASVPLPGRAPPGTKVSVVLDVPRRDLATLMPLAPPQVRLGLWAVHDGYVGAHAEVRGTAAAPEGSVDVTLGGNVLDSGMREIHLVSKLTPGGSGELGIGLDLTASGENGPAVALHSDARFAKSPLVDRQAALTHHTTLLIEQDLAKLPAELPLPPGLAGKTRIAADLTGTREDLLGKVTISAKGARKEGLQPMDIDLEATLRDADTALSGGLVIAGERLVEIAGTIGLPGKGLVPAVKTREPRALALALRVPDRPMASLAALAPRTAGMPGTVGGEVKIGGTTAAPEAQGGLSYRGYPTATGKEGRIGLDVSAKKELLTLRLVPGDIGDATVSLPLGELLAARQGEDPTDVPVTVKTRFSGDLAAALPRLADEKTMRVSGAIASDLGADLTLGVKKGDLHLRQVKTSGKLAVSDGRVELPAQKRTLHHLALALSGSGRGLDIDGLSIHESDGEKADRSIEGTGKIPLEVARDKVTLGKPTVALKLKDFLLSGGNFGEHDAPRATLTGSLAVKADLTGETRHIEVEATDLVLFSPDRQPRAHAPEILSKGDVVDAKTVPVGTLPAPPPPPEPPAKAASSEEKGLEVRVHVASARLYQAPLDLQVEGEVLVKRAPGKARELEGGLHVNSGRMLFGGKWLTFDEGEIRMSPEGPVLDVRFKKEAPAWALRDVATEGAGHDPNVRIRLAGVLGRQEAKPIGLGDSLFEALAVLNLGQVRTITRPDLPASGSPELPQTREIRQTSFMAANLPHLAFLDRAGVQSSPDDGRFSYGHLSRLDAERYFASGKRRLRLTTRPYAPGQSEGEVAYEWLFQNDKQVVSGVGVQGGTRGGGGPTVFWEWSSKD